MTRWFSLLIAVAWIVAALPASAKERIDQFTALIEVQRNGDIVVTETIDLTAEGDQIRHGILRDMPRFYENSGDRLPYSYAIQSVERDGRAEPYDTSHEDNAFRVRIGDEDTLVSAGPHEYVVRYRVRNQVRYFDRYDEVYWNATGNFWTFPILNARATLVLPPGAHVVQSASYVGALGATGSAGRFTQSGDTYTFTAERTLDAGEGLTIAVGFDKGVIDPPSQADLGLLWWQRNGALTVLIATLAGLLWFLYRAFQRVGRDPEKGPVFPRYEAPADYSPAASHYIFYRGLRGNRALIATLMNLAVKGRVRIDAADKKVTTLTAISNDAAQSTFAPEDLALERGIFAGMPVKTLGGEYDAQFTSAYEAFRTQLSQKYGTPFFRWNVGYLLVSGAVTIGVIVFAANSATTWTGWHTLAVLALAALNIAFMYFMPAPTQLGQNVRTELEGFRLYMETAEKLQLNAVKVGSAAPPPMTTARYEAFLPYAVALGVEAPWTQHFERLLPAEAAAYSPAWTTAAWGSQSFAGVSHALISNIDSGVSSAMPQSSSSSGSGGGGSSGGGGGGGGGSGW